MAKIITLDEMLEVVRESGWSEEHALFKAQMEAVGNDGDFFESCGPDKREKQS